MQVTVSAADGTPVPGTEVNLISKDDLLVSTGRTNSAGVAFLPVYFGRNSIYELLSVIGAIDPRYGILRYNG